MENPGLWFPKVTYFTIFSPSIAPTTNCYVIDTKSRKPTPSKRSSGSETKSTKEELEELEDLKAKVPKFDMDEVKKLSHNIAMQQQMGEGPDAFNKKIKKSAKPRKMNTKNTKDDVKKEPVADPPIRLHNYPTRSSQRLAKEQK